MDFAALEGVNSDIVAWLYGADTGLNYPIVQAEDNEHTTSIACWFGTWNKTGTIFMDYVNRSDFLRPEIRLVLRPPHEVRRHVRRTGAV